MKFRLTLKLPAMFAAGAALTAILVSGNDYFTATNVLEKQVAENLQNVRNGRKAEVFRFLSRVHEDLVILASGNQVRLALQDFDQEFQGIERQGKNRTMFMQHLYVVQSPAKSFSPQILDDPAIKNYAVKHALHDGWFRRIVPVRGYGDLYLISRRGDVVYSVLKKDDFATNLLNGRWRDTGLARVFRGAMMKAGVSPPPKLMPSMASGMAHGPDSNMPETMAGNKMPMDHSANMTKPGLNRGGGKSSGTENSEALSGPVKPQGKLQAGVDHSGHNRELFQDITRYIPDNGTPAGFMAVPVIDRQGNAAGVLAIRFPIQRVNAIMQEASNLGKTGDAFLVGEDFLFRSQPRFESQPFVVEKSFKGDAIEAAFRNQEGVMVTQSYDGTPVLAAYGSLIFHGAKWAVLSEMNLAEIRMPIKDMRLRMILIGSSLTVLMIFIGVFAARTVTIPLSSVSEAMDTYAKTRTIHDMPYAGRKDEIGKIAQSFNGVTKDIGTYIAEHQEAENKLAEKNQLLEVLSSKLSRYLSPQVYETIFSGQQDAAISTDRKKLTVFFSDIKDFTATTEDLEPEELTFLLNDYLTKMTDIALEYGATIDKYIGDAMLLFFGDPTTMGDQEDALACVKMAIAMQRRMVDLRAKWNEFGHERPIHMRIGINSGYCNVGNFGSEARMDYTIIGGEVNLAARLESIAEADGIMLAYGTYSLVKHEIDAKEQKPIKVKGIARDVVPYAVEGIFDDLDADRPYIRSESDAMRLYVDLRKLDEKGRAETAKELEKCAARLRET
ncbi:MAG: adenylate/guanylate cyclase domain-containing protein [Rhodospirillales bacterium]